MPRSHAGMLEYLYAAHSYACLLCALPLAISYASDQKKEMIALSHHIGAQYGVGIENLIGYAAPPGTEYEV